MSNYLPKIMRISVNYKKIQAIWL